MKIINNILIIGVSLFAAGIYSQTPVLYNGFPKVIDSLDLIYASANEAFCPLIADLDKDGLKEIVIVTQNYSYTPVVRVYKSDGTYQQGFPKPFSGESIRSTACGDVDGNGYLDIILRFYESVLVIDRFGNNLPGFPRNWGASNYLSLYDLDNDGKLEIYTTAYDQETHTGNIVVFNSTGEVRNGWPIVIDAVARMQPAIGDIDNDGLAEIIVNSYKVNPNKGRMCIYKHNGEIYSGWPVDFDSNYLCWGGSPSLFINKSNYDSTRIYLSTLRNFGEYNMNRLDKYNREGLLLKRAFSYNEDGLGTMVLGDLNEDGIVEIVVGDQYAHNLCVYDNDLQLLSGWPKDGSNQYSYQAVIGKLSNGMNILSKNQFSSWNYGYGYVFAYDINGTPLTWTPFKPYCQVNGISLADLNNDGSVEIIASGSQWQKSYLHILSVPGIPYSNNDFPWPQFAHDRYRTNQYGFIPPDDPIGIEPISNQVPRKFYLGQNYPNPFNPVTKIKFGINVTGNAKIIIYDILGREISKLVNQTLQAGLYEISWNAVEFPSGVYFYSFIFEGEEAAFSNTKKMVLLK